MATTNTVLTMLGTVPSKAAIRCAAALNSWVCDAAANPLAKSVTVLTCWLKVLYI